MKRPRKGARRPPAATHSPAHPSIEAILVERPLLRRLLLSYGVPRADVDDVLQEIAIGAVMSIRGGRYRPDPASDPAGMLRRWLFGVAMKQLGHFHGRAFRRREMPVAEPWNVVAEPSEASDLDDRLDAGDALRTVLALPMWAREVLVYASVDYGATELAHHARKEYGGRPHGRPLLFEDPTRRGLQSFAPRSR